MDKQLLQKYFKCINLSKFCETYNIGYKHMQEAMTGDHNIGKRLEDIVLPHLYQQASNDG